MPCMVFQHFPVQQYYQLLKPAATNAARAIEGYRNFAGKHYVLDEENASWQLFGRGHQLSRRRQRRICDFGAVWVFRDFRGA